MIKTACLSALLLAATTTGRAEEHDNSLAERIDAVFAPWDHDDGPGAAVAVYRDGETIYAHGYGRAHLEYDIPVTPQTIFHVASVSKQFTALALVLLAEEGKLSLDDEIHQYLPEVPDFGAPITIRQLLNHTSGLRDQWQLLAMAGWRLDDVITREHVLTLVRRQRELNFPPGSEHMYCNTGYTLAAEIVSRVSGKSFPEFTQERIFEPLGMTRTHFHDDHQHIVPGRAYSYEGQNGDYRNRVLSYANVGATSLFTTAEDLARWLANFDEPQIGGTGAFKKLYKRGKLADGKKIAYALGLEHGKHRGMGTLGHGGADAGFRTQILYIPDKKLGVVVLGNLASFDASKTARAVADAVLGEDSTKEPAKQQEAERVAVEQQELERCAGWYRLSSGAVAKTYVRNGKLWARLAGDDPFELVPVEGGAFFVQQIGGRVEFKDAEQDKYQQVTVDGPQKLTGERVAAEDVSPLADFVGRYYSEELDTAYEIVKQDDTLVATHIRNEDVRLDPLGPGEFAGSRWFLASVRFERDEEGNVTGLLAGGGRVRNLAFKKVGTATASSAEK